MKKALLIGNGFTLYLINAYGNKSMMDEFHKKLLSLLNELIGILAYLEI
jgi:hypothetical protein